MPAVSKSQQRLFALAEHNPGELYARNKSLANLPKQTLHDFAATKTKKLPARKAAAPKKKPPRVAAVSVKIPKKPVHPALQVIREH